MSAGDRLDELIRLHKTKYSRRFMFRRFCQHVKQIGEDIEKYPAGKRLLMAERYQRFLRYLLLKLDDILTGDPHTLHSIIEHIETNYGMLPFRSGDYLEVDGNNRPIQTNLYKGLVHIFNYKAFCEDEQKGAYPLAAALRTEVCPYCNRQYIHTHNDEALKLRATLDHFCDKGTYPFLSISLFNLIPSCYFCNSIIKHTKRFSLKTHIHPYVNAFDHHMRFVVQFPRGGDGDIDYTQILQAEPGSFRIGFRSGREADPATVKLARKSIHDLKLRELYRVHTDYVGELIHKSVVYNDAFVKSLFEAHPRLFASEEEIYRMALGSYMNTGDFGKRALSKLTSDIAEQFRLTDKLRFPASSRLIRRRNRK